MGYQRLAAAALAARVLSNDAAEYYHEAELAPYFDEMMASKQHGFDADTILAERHRRVNQTTADCPMRKAGISFSANALLASITSRRLSPRRLELVAAARSFITKSITQFSPIVIIILISS